MFLFYEFFAGGGMARCGLGKSWHCLFANDFDHKKAESYSRNWGDDALTVSDVRDITVSDLPDVADLAWASFPCQDLSLAGNGAGLKGERSGTFWPFWKLIGNLSSEGRAPRTIVLENVVGTLTSHNGKDFQSICSAISSLGYNFGALVIDAARFVPQSRPRLFIIATRSDVPVTDGMRCDLHECEWTSPSLIRAFRNLSQDEQGKWIWWKLPTPSNRNSSLTDLIEAVPVSVDWHTSEETHRLLLMMNEKNLAKVEAAKHQRRRVVGTIYKRTRKDEQGRKVQRAEIRFDELAGCLRTPAGGSSRQLIMMVDGDIVRSRLISSRETARLMGLPDEYVLPDKYYDAYHLTGDGVVVPVVRHLAQCIVEPILTQKQISDQRAA